MDDPWKEIKKHLEPVCINYWTSPYQDVQLSIAISLKRIADNMELTKSTTKIDGVSIKFPKFNV